MGRLERDLNWKLVYVGGEETIFDNVNVEKLSMLLMENLFKGLSYKKYDDMYWLDEELGINGGGLYPIKGDAAVVMKYKWALNHDSKVHVYFEHPVDKAVTVEVVDLDDNNFVPPQVPPAANTPKKNRIKKRANRTPTPKKKPANRKPAQAKQNLQPKLKEEVDIPRSQPPPLTQSQPQPESQSELQPQPQPQTQTSTAPKPNRRAAYKRPAPSGQQFVKGNKDGAPKIYVPIEDPNSSDSDPGYHGYESEELADPDNDEEEKEKDESSWPQGNPGASWGSVHLELGMEFGTLDEYKRAVRKFNI
ncbi:hypothetical protein PIB30_047373 [Stylosanthes scabra]|uniref:PB1-like domain-containing protein n=1 Tax=Stylosanthes scabra TaxID=79078 RepID=A0ABU6WK44_9FABA|nr:hypothetical protein [Stylosanthes scabra]